MATLYVTISCAFLAWFRLAQELQGRSYPFVGISCLYGIWMLASGTTIPLDGITVSVLAFVLWLFCSLLWCEKQYGVFELFIWMSYMMVFLAARTIPLELIVWILLLNSAIFAALQIYYQARDLINDNTFPVFGNSNHNSSFLLVGLYSSLWLALNGVPLMWGFVLLIGFAITRTRCRGTILAMILSFILAAGLIKSEILLYVTGIMFVFALARGKFLYRLVSGSSSIKERLAIYKDALKRLHPRYLLGRGLNYYRVGTWYGRVHNDHLELIGEVGLIGYLLFLNIFFQLQFNPLIFCAIIALFISGMFFFPFREVHTAAPFWALIGAGAGVSLSGSFLILKITGVLALIAIMVFVFTVFCNLMDWKVSEMKKSEVT